MTIFRTSTRSQLLGTLLLAVSAGAGAEDAPTAPQALVKIDDFAVTNLHLALFGGQTGRNPSDPAQQISLLNELVNHFMVARSAKGKALASNAEVAAALEVARARLLAQAFIRDEARKADTSEAAVEARFQANYGSADRVEYKARHILLSSAEDAVAVIEALDGGAEFAKLASERSTGPSKVQGGDLGWFEADQMVPPFSKATAALENGAYSTTPVKTQFGWHVILREDSRKAPPPSLDSVRDEIKQEIQQEYVAKAITEVRESIRIEVVNPEQ